MMCVERLRHLRKQKDVTQEIVAEAVGVSRSTYALYENGTREPKIYTLIQIADFFNVSIDYLVGRSAHTTSNNDDPADLDRERIEEVINSLRDYCNKLSDMKRHSVFFGQLTAYLVGMINTYSNLVYKLRQGKKPYREYLSLVAIANSLQLMLIDDFTYCNAENPQTEFFDFIREV